MRKLTKEQINDILATTAKTGDVDLSNADLSDIDLRGADLSGADLSGSVLINANLSGANLENANLCGAVMRYAYLFRANLRWANMSSIQAECASFALADLCGVDFRRANLAFAKFKDADLTHAIFNYQTDIHMAIFDHACLDGISGLDSACPIACPETGSFIGWKKVGVSVKYLAIENWTIDTAIVKLRILEDAKRSSATSRKCRCSAAMVEEIQTRDGKRIITDSSNIFRSFHDPNFIYETGKIVSVSDFDDNRWTECSTGIHFFITREEAVNY